MLNNDLRDAFRAIRRRPVYALVSIATLTLGVGVVLAIFSLANVLLIRPLPGISDPDRLVRVMRVDRVGTGASPMSYPLYEAVRDAVPAFSGVATQQPMTVDITTGDGATPRRTVMELVSGNYFEVLGAGVQRGRPLAQRDVDEAAPVVVVSSAKCESVQPGGACVGKTLTLNGNGPVRDCRRRTGRVWRHLASGAERRVGADIPHDVHHRRGRRSAEEPGDLVPGGLRRPAPPRRNDGGRAGAARRRGRDRRVVVSDLRAARTV